MLRQMIEEKVGKLRDEEYTNIINHTEKHIKNRIANKKMTYLSDFLRISEKFSGIRA